MADTTYTATVARVRDWSNRNDSPAALPDTVIRDALDFAADEAYRLLEVASLERTGSYPALTASDVNEAIPFSRGVGTLRVPRDSTGKFLQLRRIGSEDTPTESVVFNSRRDLRAFEDQYHADSGECTWTRKGDEILMKPATENDIFELHYYRRLPALDATYTVNPSNFASNLLTEATAQDGTEGTALFFVAGTTTNPVAAQNAAGDLVATYYVGNEAFHWLRDEQNKILLFGALWHVYNYLESHQEAQVWADKFQLEIQSLNSEERMRRASGGNIQVSYEGRGLI